MKLIRSSKVAANTFLFCSVAYQYCCPKAKYSYYTFNYVLSLWACSVIMIHNAITLVSTYFLVFFFLYFDIIGKSRGNRKQSGRERVQWCSAHKVISADISLLSDLEKHKSILTASKGKKTLTCKTGIAVNVER